MRKKMLTVVAFVVLVTSGVQAQESGGDMETWHCFDTADFSQEKVLFSLTRKGAGGRGVVCRASPIRHDFRSLGSIAAGILATTKARISSCTP